MARGRMLNKTISLSQKFADLPDDTCRLFATWSIAFLDIRGVFYADPIIVRAQVLTMRDDITTAQVSGYLKAMEEVGLIVTFEAKGRRWQYWPGFADNQIGIRDDREKSDFPPPPTNITELELRDGYDHGDSHPEEIPHESRDIPENIPPKGKEVQVKEKEKGKGISESDDSPPAPPPSPKKSRSRKSATDERSSHPAILAFREVTSRYPQKELYDEVICIIGDKPNIQRMKSCWVDWLKVSGNRANTTWLLEWYAGGHSGNPNRPGKVTHPTQSARQVLAYKP